MPDIATEPSRATTIVRGACPHDCPDTCATLVTVEAGRAVRIAGDPAHPVTRGFLCTKVNRYLDRTYHPDRLTRPLRRSGPKGSGQFTPVSWDEALGDIASRLDGIRRSVHGPQAILPYSYSGTLGLVQGESMDRRFFHLLGASRLDRTICSTAGEFALRMTIGSQVGPDVEAVPQSDLIILWGTNTLSSNPHLWPFVLRARERGTPVIGIDPIRTRTIEQCDEWIAIRPGTDAALALGMMHVIFAEGLEDRDYLDRYTVGADGLRARAAEYPPARTAEITGIPAEIISGLARRYAAARAAFVRINYGMQRHYGGGMAVRTVLCLPAVTGHWRRAGGGVQLSTSGAFAYDRPSLQRTDLSPPVRTINMVRLGEALTTDDAGVGGPPVSALIVYNSNPAAIAPDRNTVLRGLAREDLFTVVLEHFQTDTADYADYVLPATTQLEHWDVHYAYGHYFATLNRPAIAPVGESKPNSEIFRLLGRRLGLTHPALADDDLALIRQALGSADPRLQGVTFETLMRDGWARLNLPRPFVPFAEGAFGTASGKCELHSSALAELGYDPLPTYTPPRESPAEVPSRAALYPLTLISSPRHQFLNSTFVNVESLRHGAEPECRLHPHDAEPRGIRDGATVGVYNDRGRFLAVARVNEGIRPGVVWAPSLWWGRLTADRQNANATTSAQETDMGHGSVFYDNLVEVVLA